MKTLIIAATEEEIASIKKQALPHCTCQITGIGAAATIYHLMKALHQEQYDWIIQAGIGGSFSQELSIGEVVAISADRFADIGAEEADGTFLNFFENGLINPNQFPFTKATLPNPHIELLPIASLKKVRGLTVSTASGSMPTIRQRANMEAEVESMEGAALHYVGLQENQKFLQLRAISNYVTPRNKNDWQTDKAIAALNDLVISLVHKIQL